MKGNPDPVPGNRKIFAMPIKKGRLTLTPAGFQFMLVISAMLIAAINYSNAMAYLLVFFCMALMAVSMLYARSNLIGLELKSVQPRPAFAGGQIRIAFEVKNNSIRKHRGLLIRLRDQGGVIRFSKPFFLDSGSVGLVDVFLPVFRRGFYGMEGLIIETFFPLGLFRFRKTVSLESGYLVFPMPAGRQPWPAPRTVWFESVEGFHFSGGDDFAGLRPYRTGESQHHVDWKAYARGRPLSIKEFSSGGSLQYWFDWSALPALGVEERLSQLTRWILEADQQGTEFGLRLPGEEHEPDSSSLHTQKCLTALALFGGQR